MAEYNITAQIVYALREYNDQVAKSIDIAGEKCASGLVKDLKHNSPKLKGDYQKSWTKKRSTGYFSYIKIYTIFNKDHYRLTSLLEHGHDGPAPAPPHAHIKPLEKKWTNEFEKLCEEACEG